MTTMTTTVRRVRRRAAAGLFDELVVDLFAGGGGASLGIEHGLRRCVDVACNHDHDAVTCHIANHPRTRHLQCDVFEVDPIEASGGRPVGLLWASPDCRHFSRAKGAKPVSKRVRSLAWVVHKWAAAPEPVRPRVIILENVREFQDWGPLVGDRPCPDRKGRTFRAWISGLRSKGYEVDWRVLDAADYGAPTHRRRLFVIARRDGRPIVWPEPTHGPKRRPWRTAAECIDWSIPVRSIFDRPRPLAENTLRRIALGIWRYVLSAPAPFIVQVNHGGAEFRGQELDEPLPVVPGKHGFGLVAPTLVGAGGAEYAGKPTRVDRPGTSVLPQDRRHLCAALLTQHYGGMVGKPIAAPVPAVTGTDHNALTAATLMRIGQTGGGGKYCSDPRDPIGATTTKAEHCVVASCLVRMNHGEKQWNGVDEPLGTQTSQGNKAGLVYAFLVKYFGTAIGAPLAEPLHTVTGLPRFGLVMIETRPGVAEPAVCIDVPGYGPHVIADIGMRMLEPRELARAQGFPDHYCLPPVKSRAVRLIGNSVCPPVAEALVRANCGGMS